MRGTRTASTLALAAAALLSAAASRADQGSNLGSHGTPYRPPAITGTVRDAGGRPVPGARVATLDGHFTATGADGAFTLHVDVPGLYDVVVSGAGVVLPATEVVVDGDGVARDFELDVGAPEPPAGPVPLRFDFGTPSSPLAAGYVRVSESTAYGAAGGFGWSAGARASRSRGSGTSLSRDFVFCTSCTFQVAVPEGTYVLRLAAGDTAAAHDGMRYTAEGVVLDTLTTASGQVVERVFTVEVTDGRLTLEVADTGGSDANAVLNALEVAPLWPRVYDFGTADSPVEAGAFRVTHAAAYAASHGHGWISGSRGSRDRGAGGDTVRDFVFSPAATFAVDVPEGRYDVTVLMGDADVGHDLMGVHLEGTKVDSVTVAAGAASLLTYTVPVSDGQLTVLLDDDGGADANVVLNGLRVEPARPLKLDFGTATSPVAPGWARVRAGLGYDAVRGYGWAAGAVAERDRGGSNPLGRDLNFSPDATFRADVPAGWWDVVVTIGDAAAAHDAMAVIVEGEQREVVSTAAGQLVERVYRTAVGDGELTLRLDDTGGSDANAVINALCVLPACSFRFDFGTVSSPLEPGYARVAHTTSYGVARGYGWLSGAVDSRDRGSETPLRRDLNFTSAATFAVDLADGIYDVAVTLGDRVAAHDRMEVSFEGTVAGEVSTSAGQFTQVRARVPVNDGQLTVLLDDAGGVDAFVVVNALTVECADRFDFGTSTSPVAPSHVRVAADPFSAVAGWGWTGGAVAARDRAAGDDLLRDLNFTALGTFEAVVPDGGYAVTLAFADPAASHDAMGILLEGELVDTITLARGQISVRTYFVTVSDGRLTLGLDDKGGADPNVVLSGMTIRRSGGT